MYLYHIFGLGIESDFQMKEADLQVHLDHIDVVIKEGISNTEYTKDRIYDNKEDRFLVNSTQEGIYIQVAHQGTFLMEKGKTIRYHLKPENNPDYIEQIILCFCLGVIMAQQDKVVLHGSGIVIQNRVFVISGNSGAGKSALSTALINSGLQYIADDAVAVECLGEIKAHSGYPQRKLCLDTMRYFHIQTEDCEIIPDVEDIKYSMKHPDQYYKESLPLGGLIVIMPEEGKAVELTKITGNEKMRLIIDNLYKKNIYNLLGFNKHIFDQCMKIAKLINVYVLTRPVNQMTVTEQMNALNDILYGEITK